MVYASIDLIGFMESIVYRQLVESCCRLIVV